MNKIFIKNLDTGRELTREQFDIEVDKIHFADNLKYVAIECYDPLDAVIKMRAAIKNKIVFLMIPVNSTQYENSVLFERIDNVFKPKPDGYMLATTSGSTTQSKIIFSTRKEREKASMHMVEQLKVTPDDTMFLLNFAGNGAWINSLTIAILGGATILLSNEKDISKISHFINEDKPTIVYSSPAMMASLMNNDPNDTFGSNVRCWYLGGSAPNKEDGYKMEKRLGEGKVINGYLYADGNLPLVCSIDDTIEHRIETVGVDLVPNAMRIIDGELQIHPDHIISAIDGEQNFTEDGWYLSGDLFEQDDEGYYKIVGRKKLLLSYGAYTINPLEVEELVDTIPGVIKSYCVDFDVKFKHKRPREINNICVCVKRGNTDLTKDEIKNFLYSRVSLGKRFFIRFIDEFPLTHSGKIDRTALSNLLTSYEFDKIFMHNLDTDRKITMKQFDAEIDKIAYDDSTECVIIDGTDSIEAAIQMFAAIKNNIVFTMMTKSTTTYSQAIIKERIKKSLKPKSGGFQITTSGGQASQAKLLYATKDQRDKHSEILIQQLELSDKDVVFNSRNSGSGPWINMTRQCKKVGATMLVTNKRSPEKIASAINELIDITIIASTPRLMSYLTELTDIHNAKSNIRCWHVSGSPTAADDAYKMEEKMNGCKFIQTLGRAEGVLPYGCDLNDTVDHRINTIGKEIVDGSTRIVDGEMQIAKEWVISMLDGNHVFTDDGWYKTNDLVEQDAEGYYTVIGCKKPILSYGPRDLSPFEAEEIIDTMDGVEKSYCIDITFRGEPTVKHPCICVKRVNAALTEDIVIETMSEKLGFTPQVRWIDELTLNDDDEINRVFLTAMFKNSELS